MREGRTEEAMEVFHHLLAVNPNNAIAYNLIGYYWMGRGDFAQAEDNLKRYRFLAPDQANPYDSLGEMYANIGRYEEADEALGKALQLKPDFVASVGHLGTVAVGRGNFALAAEKFHHAAALSDDLGQSTQFQLAEAMSIFRTKGPKEALTLLDTLPVLSVEASNGSTKEAKALVVLVRAALSGEELSPEAVSQPEAIPAGGVAQKSGKARRHDSAVAARLIQAIRRAEKGDLAPGREATAKELPAFAETVGEFSFFPYFPLLWVDLADRLGKGGAIGEASEILKVILARNSKFQPALDVQAAIRGEAGAKKALSSPPGA
jgi:tetratricopeptide (TPR) repeat protein